ncbi:MAG: hypothetical protein Q8L66_16090 [Caulobacter sp.]|nr:hypothetical protein [Caulobacter sp.]
MTQPYALPASLSPDLKTVEAYWRSLLRGSAEMPFWDDIDLTTMPSLAGRLFVVGAFDKPDRYRLEIVGETLARAAGKEIAGLFVDELRLPPPLAFLGSQASATVEAAAPTYHEEPGQAGYRRLLLPMWGDGHISMLLGVVDLVEA